MNIELAQEVSKVSANLEIISMLLKTLLGAGGVICTLIVFLWKFNNKAIASEIGHVDKKAEVAIHKADEIDAKLDNNVNAIHREFVSIQSCDRRHHI